MMLLLWTICYYNILSIIKKTILSRLFFHKLQTNSIRNLTRNLIYVSIQNTQHVLLLGRIVCLLFEILQSFSMYLLT